MCYPGTKFEVARSNGLGGDAFTRNVTDGCMHGRTDGRTDGPTLERNKYTPFCKDKKRV